MSNLGDMNMTPEQLETADEGAGWNLIVPDKAKAARKSGVARWLEVVKITNAYREDKIGDKNQLRILFTVEYDVLSGGDEPRNVGRSGSIRMLTNPGFVNAKKAEALGDGSAKGESLMHAMSMKKFKQVLVASGIGVAAALTPDVIDALYPLTNGSALIGKQLALIMSDNDKDKYNDENRQEPAQILIAPTA